MMDIDSDKTRAFSELAKVGSFSKAAVVLGISQSALSQKIAKLESELGVTLVIRDQKEMKLTQAGVELVRYYQQKSTLDAEFIRGLSSATGNKKLIGTVKIAGYSSITRSALIPVLTPLLSTNPELHFNIFSKEIYELERLLQSGEVDFILSNKPVKKDNVENIVIHQEEVVHIVSAKAQKTCPVFLDHDEADETTFDFFREQGLSLDFRRSYMDDIYALIDGVESNLGQAVAAKHLIVDNKKIKIIPHKKKVKTDVILSYFKRQYYSDLQKKIITILSEDLKQYF